MPLRSLRERARPAFTLALRPVRSATGVTQVELGQRLDVNANRISQLEHCPDLLLSTLHRYVRALGAQLEITAVIKGRRVPLIRPIRQGRGAPA